MLIILILCQCKVLKIAQKCGMTNFEIEIVAHWIREKSEYSFFSIFHETFPDTQHSRA